MFREFLTQSDLLHFPVLAMLIFFGVFLAVVIHTLTGLRKSRVVSQMAALPLEEEDSSLTEEAR